MTSAEVIDWTQAMEQCGDDEEFLHELLGDLQTETLAQLVKIEDTFRSQLPFHELCDRIMRASHVIKGAASNLMCTQLKNAATELERAAYAAKASGDASANLGTLQTAHANFVQAVQAFQTFLDSLSKQG